MGIFFLHERERRGRKGTDESEMENGQEEKKEERRKRILFLLSFMHTKEKEEGRGGDVTR